MLGEFSLLMHIFLKIILSAVGPICEVALNMYLSSEELPFVIEGSKVQLTTVEFISIAFFFLVNVKLF